VPISIFIFFNAPEILQFLFQRGLFDKSATFLTGSLLSIYSLILFASLSLGVIYSFYQSQNKFKTIIIFSALGLALNAILNYIFLKPFGAKGIISATVISNYIIFVIGTILVCKYLKESLFRFTFNYLCFIGILALITALIVNFLAINIILKTLIYFLLTYSLLVLLDVPKPLRIKEMSFNAIKKYIKR
jgi:peptidoglycan biosynthesis protein MviN/MurJ (putative lipid II flippase)